MDILIIIIVVVVCNFWLYTSLKNKLDSRTERDLPPINIHCPPQVSSPQPISAPPQVSVYPTPPTDEELTAVVMAAIAAHESEEAAEASQTNNFSIQTQAPSAQVHEVERYKYNRPVQRWAAAARHESHKRI